MAKPRFPGKPHRLLSRNRTRISNSSAQHDEDTVDVVGNICLGLAIFKHNFGDDEEPYVPGVNGFKGFSPRQISESRIRAKRKLKEAEGCDVTRLTSLTAVCSPTPPKKSIIKEAKNEVIEVNSEVVGVPVSKRARRKGGGRKPRTKVPKQEISFENVEAIKEETVVKEEPVVKEEADPTTRVSMLSEVESPLSLVGHPLIVEGKRRWKPTYKVLQGPSSLEDSRRLGGEAWPFGARPIHRAVEAPAPIGGKFVTGSSEKEQDGKNSWKSGALSLGTRPSGGGILREARLRIDSAASGSEDGEWVRRMMDETDKNKKVSVTEPPKSSLPTSNIEGSSVEKNPLENEFSPARVYCRICKGAMSRRFSKRKTGKRGVWSCKACREFVAEMTKKLRNDKSGDGSQDKEGTTPATPLVCRGGKGKCVDEDGWPQAPPQRCVPCWLRICLNAPAPHLIPCPVSRTALRKLLPQTEQTQKEPVKRGKKRRGRKLVHQKGKRQKVTAEGPRVKHVCRSAMAVLGRPPATFPTRETLKANGGEAPTIQENASSGESKAGDGNSDQRRAENADQAGDSAEASSPPILDTFGAHQWWKQRKGMHRRRKRGRLTLNMPRRDGRLSLHRSMPKLLSVSKPGAAPTPKAAPASAADLGPPVQLEGCPFRPDAAEVFTNGFGVIQVSPNIMPVQPLCFLCGSGGKQWLVHCALCCEPFHTFCVEWAGWDVFDGWDVQVKGPPKLRDGEKFLPLEWICRRCSLCHACGLPAYAPGVGMPSVSSKGNKVREQKAIEKKGEEEGETRRDRKKQKEVESANGEEDLEENEIVEDMGTRTCNLCHRCYHGVCLGPSTGNQKNWDLAAFKDKDKPWVCSSCLRCHSCGKNSVAGSVPRNHLDAEKYGERSDPPLTGPEDVLMCAACLGLHRKGNFCPLCHVVYRDTDFDASMMQCAKCSYWVHASCEGLSDDQYHLLSLLPSSVEFTCSPCTKKPSPPWRKAMDRKLRQGLEKILDALEPVFNAKSHPAISDSLALTEVAVSNQIPSNIPDTVHSMNHLQKELETSPKTLNQDHLRECDLPVEHSDLNVASSDKNPTSNVDLVSLSNFGDIDNKSDCEGGIRKSDKAKISQDINRSVAQISDKPTDILLVLKDRIDAGDFGALNDFYGAVEKVFLDNEKVLSLLHSALVKVFPWVKPKFCTRDTKEKLDIFLNDHCYIAFSKAYDFLKWIPKTISEEENSPTKIDVSDNISLKSNSPSCDLQSSIKILDDDSGSSKDCSVNNVNNECSNPKEQPNHNENLWMDPSDYIPNHKVYSFASALRRRSINRNSISLSIKNSPLKSESSCKEPSDNCVTLEHSKDIVTYKSVLAGIKKELLGCEESPKSCDELIFNHTNLKDPTSQEKQDSIAKDCPISNCESKIPCSDISFEKECAVALSPEKTLISDIPVSETSPTNSTTEVNKKCESSVSLEVKSLNAGHHESSLRTDSRRCLFCHIKGDADVNREGRLLLASSFGDWVHCNCALWSAEVYEEKGGFLMKVREAINRGRRVRCALCRDTGATLGCCLRGCPDSYHLGCALRSGCLLLEDKSVYCRNHIPDDQKDCRVDLPLKRPVQVHMEGCKGSLLRRWKKGRGKKKAGEGGTAVPLGSIKFSVGSLHVENLGKILPGNLQGQFLRPPEGKAKESNEDEMRWCEGGVSLAKKDEEDSKVPEVLISGGAPVIVPVGFSCTRLYWSSVEPWKVIEYRVQTILVISELEESNTPVNEEKVDIFNEDEDMQAHVTVDHTAEAEDLNQVRNDEEPSDMIVPSDLSDEIIKDLPPDLLTNNKLMQSILVGLLKGASNGEMGNSISHSSFEDDEEGKAPTSNKDYESPVSPLRQNHTDQVAQVPRHNRPVNVVQPVSKEILLSAESGSQAWELTCEMRPAQTPPLSASPTMTGAAGNTPELTTIIVPENKPAIWADDSKESWKRMRPIPQLDGNADPSSSSSEGGGSSPVRTSPIQEAPQPIPCLLACRIKQQSLAHSEPGGGGPVKCNECKRTYRTQEGYDRHLCETPLPLSSTSSDSDSEDRTSRRVSSESDAAVQGEEMQPQSVEAEDCFIEYPEKKAMDSNSAEISPLEKDDCPNSGHEPNPAVQKEDNLPEVQTHITIPDILAVPSDANQEHNCHDSINTSKICNESDICDVSIGAEVPAEVHDHFVDESFSAKEPKELSDPMMDSHTVSTNEVEVKSPGNVGISIGQNCHSNVYSENESHNNERTTESNSSQVGSSKEVKDGAWKSLMADNCPTRITKRQTAMVQPLCYINGKRKIPSGETPDLSKASRVNMTPEENYVCDTQPHVPQGTIPQPPIVSSSIPQPVNNNFQVLVRQLPSTNSLPQFAENFRQQTGHTLQYLATIDPNSFGQQPQIPQPQGLVSLIQGSAQIMQTPTIVAPPQVVTSSPIVLAPQQSTLVYNPVTACLEAVPTQQQSYILTPPPPTYSIPVSSSMPYSLSQDVQQVYFQSAPMAPPAPPPPPSPQLEPIIQTETGWSLAPGYQLVQNQQMEQPQTLLIPAPTPAPMAQINIPLQYHQAAVNSPHHPHVPAKGLSPNFHPPTPIKKKRAILPSIPNKLRDSIVAYRRDENTGRYIPIEEGWQDSSSVHIQKTQVSNEKFCLKQGMSPSIFTSDAKDSNKKDVVGFLRKKSTGRKSDGETSGGHANEAVQKQNNKMKFVRVLSPQNCWRAVSKDMGNLTSDSMDCGAELRLDSENSTTEPSSSDKAVKRVESASVMYQVHSADGFTLQSDTPDKIWDQVFKTVQDARIAHGLAPLPRNPFSPMSGSKPFMGAETLALSHKGLRYLLNQLPGASQLLESKSSTSETTSTAMAPPHKLFSRAHLSLSTQAPAPETPSVPPPPSSPPLPENPTGCARSEPFKCPPPPTNPLAPGEPCPSFKNRKWRHRDIFGWLASPHRKLPMAPLPTQENEVNGGGNRRATSLDLPMAMRFRHLKETSREAVGVYRSHIHGRGLFCLKDIEAGEMVIEYSGEVIRSSLTDTREKTYEAKGMGCYMFRIDEQTVVDATMRGNAARFINHSCDPNCYSRVVDILGKKHILIFALRRIPRGEELTYDYKFPFEDVKIPCHCTSKRCRKYLN